MNTSLYTHVTTETVPYWIRILVANRMAKGGEDWAQYFSLYNSGTYNNQWIIVDYKLFTPDQDLQPNTLWIAEQIPGYVVAQDQTDVLISTSYWASYNIPFYQFIYDISEYPAYLSKYGNDWSYSKCARAQIFARDETQVVSFEDMKKIMRYNQYQIDPLSLQDACKGISARCDLNTPWSGSTLNGWVAFGAIDAKISDEDKVPKLETKAISGPTWDNQPPFAWTNEWATVPHFGQPKVFAFDWETMVPKHRHD